MRDHPAGVLHVVAQTTVVLGAASAVGLTWYATHRVGSPLLLQCLFVGWVLLPFVVLGVTGAVSRRWPASVRSALDVITLCTTAFSIAVYAIVALAPARPKAAAFVLTSPASVVLAGILLAAVAVMSARDRRGRV